MRVGVGGGVDGESLGGERKGSRHTEIQPGRQEWWDTGKGRCRVERGSGGVGGEGGREAAGGEIGNACRLR